MALCLEGFEVVLYSATEEGAALFQGWLIDDYLSTLSLDTLHNALWIADWRKLSLFDCKSPLERNY